MNNRNDFKSIYVVMLGLLLFALYLLYRIYIVNPNLDKRYMAEYDIVNGHIKSFGEFSTGANKLTKVGYVYNGMEHEIELFYDAPCRESDIKNSETRMELMQLSIPVAVSLSNPEYAICLLRPEDFKRINRPLPDSLSDRYDRYFNCTLMEEILKND